MSTAEGVEYGVNDMCSTMTEVLKRVYQVITLAHPRNTLWTHCNPTLTIAGMMKLEQMVW